MVVADRSANGHRLESEPCPIEQLACIRYRPRRERPDRTWRTTGGHPARERGAGRGERGVEPPFRSRTRRNRASIWGRPANVRRWPRVLGLSTGVTKMMIARALGKVAATTARN